MKGKTFIIWILSLFGLMAAPLEIGADLPKLRAKTHEGKKIKLQADEGDDYLFVFFYPKAMTPGCTKQACSVRDSFDALREKKVTIFGVSADDVDAQKAFVEKEELNYRLLADPEGEIIKAFGVPLVMNKLSSRQAYLFKNGKLIWRDTQGATDKQGEEVLAAIAEEEKAGK